MKGQFIFTVATSGIAPSATGNTAANAAPAQQGNPTPSQTQAVLSASTQPTGETSGSSEEAQFSIAQSITRWLGYLAMITLAGGFPFYQFVFKPSLQQAYTVGTQEREIVLQASARRIVLLSWASLAMLIITAIAGLVLQASAVFDKSMGESFSMTLMDRILMRTGFGKAWLIEVAAIIALIVVILFLARGNRHTPTQDHRVLWWSGLVASCVLLLSPGFTGHTAAAANEYRFARVSDWLHLLAGAVWIGGLFHFALTMPPTLLRLGGRERMDVLYRAIPLFTRLAVASVVLMTLTGIYNSWEHIDSFSALWSTSYGETLLLKIALIAPMLLLGGINTFIIHPRIARQLESQANVPAFDDRALARSFYRSVTVEAILGVMVLLVASVLVFLLPARQHPIRITKTSESTLIQHKG